MPFTFNPNPADAALAFFRAKGWILGFDYRDVWRAEHLTAFTVAKAMELDVLSAIRYEVDRALESGTTFAEFKRTLTPTLQRMGWWGKAKAVDPLTGGLRDVQLGSPSRLKTIYRTNMRTARAAGQWERVEQTQDTTHPYLLYSLGPSRVHREQHVAWNGLLLPASDPWWTSHYPPNGWNCRCRVRQVSRVEQGRRGMSLGSAPPSRMRRVVNKRTSQVDYVPEGIDPGWDYHPGQRRVEKLQETLERKRRDTATLLGQEVPSTPIPPGLSPA